MRRQVYRGDLLGVSQKERTDASTIAKGEMIKAFCGGTLRKNKMKRNSLRSSKLFQRHQVTLSFATRGNPNRREETTNERQGRVREQECSVEERALGTWFVDVKDQFRGPLRTSVAVRWP